jgi:ABC-type branched-chain amino acid transport systems, periplasmic component
MNRRVSCAVLAAALAVALGACGRSSDAGGGGGLTAAPGFDPVAKTITLGVLTSETGPTASIGAAFTGGLQAYVGRVNAAGGVGNQYRIELEKADTKYDPPTAVQQYQRLKNDVAVIAQVIGTGSVASLAPQLEADNVIASPAAYDAAWSVHPQLLPIAAPFQVQVLNAAHWYVTDGGGTGKRICGLVIDNPYGAAVSEGLADSAAAEGYAVAASEKFAATDQDFSAKIAALQRAACDAVFLATFPSNTVPVLAAAQQAGFAPQWFGLGGAFVSALSANPQAAPLLTADNVRIVNEGPQWGDTGVEGMRDLVADIEKYAPGTAAESYTAFGYAQGIAVVALLEKAVANGDLSRHGLKAASAQLGTLSFKGLFGDYTYGQPDKRVNSTTSTIFRVDPARPGGLAVDIGPNFTSGPAEDYHFTP